MGDKTKYWFAQCKECCGRFGGGWMGNVRSIVVARWSAGQQVERLILHQGHDSSQNSSH